MEGKQKIASWSLECFSADFFMHFAFAFVAVENVKNEMNAGRM